MKKPISSRSFPALWPPLSSAALAVLAGAALVLPFAPAARAGLAIPYAQDAHTMHLWHLNDTNGLFAADFATNFVVDTATPIQLENFGEPTPGTFPYTNTFFGAPGPGYPGLSTAYSGTSKQHLLAGFNGSSFGGQFADVSQFCNPTTGAFTFEAVVNVNAALSSIDAEILCGDDNNSSIANRGWQWRLENGAMEWDLLAGSTDNDFKPLLPTSGPDSAKLNAWYHMAVTYTGQTPTNTDQPGVFTMYWTALDPSRTTADVLAQYTNDAASPYGIRPLSGSPEGAATPSLGIGGSARNVTGNPGNNEGLIGSILEVRVSDIARAANDMAFSPGGSFPPVITVEPPTNVLVGYGQPLAFGPVVSGTQPLTYSWFLNNTNLTAQTNLDVSTVSPTFADGGSYYVVISNAYGSITSSVTQVTIGAAASALFPTGIDTNGQPSVGDIPDAHYTIVSSYDPSYLGPNAYVFEWNTPIQFSPGGGNYGPTNGYSTWIGVEGNLGGAANASPGGSYIYRTTFLLDQANPATVTLQGSVILTGTITNILLNGKSTGISLTPINSQFIPSPFTITNGFVAGLNTLDFCQTIPTAGANSAIYVEQISAIGQADAPGVPVISQQPANQTVRDAALTGSGSAAKFSVIATGRPPLSYQWLANGSPLIGATNYALNIYNPTAGSPTTNYSVTISNTSGSVTSSPAAVLTIVPTNQPPITAPVNLVDFGLGTTVQASYLLDVADQDPDGDLISYVSSASASTVGATNGQNNVNVNGTGLDYTPVSGFLGLDQFTYTVQDSLGAMSTGVVNVLELSEPQQFTTVLVGGTTNLTVGGTNTPGYSFQWELYGTNVAGAQSSQLVISNAQATNAGSYVLSVANAQGVAVSSAPALVALNGAPGPKFNVNPLDWVFNGYGTASNLNGNVLSLTDGALSEGRSAWFGWPQSITNFSASFIYQDVGGGGADGFVFVLQNSSSGTAAIGPGGGDLGYTGIGNSVGLEFNVYSNNTVGIALQDNGNVSPPFTPITPVNPASGDPIAVTISYAAGMAQVTFTDLTTTLSTNMTIDVASVLGDTFENIIGSDTAYVGFTCGSGGVGAKQMISNFVFAPPSTALNVQRTATNTVALSWTPSYSGFVLQSATSVNGAWQNVTQPVNVVGAQYQVVAPQSSSAQFYRLILP